MTRRSETQRWSGHARVTLGCVVLAVVCMALVPSPDRLSALGAILGVWLVMVTLGVFSIRLGYFVKAFCRGDTAQRVVALTFDDGPDPDVTPRVLDLLRERGVTATFFLIGDRAAAHPGVARRIADDGHSVGNHSHRHAWFTNFMCRRTLTQEYETASRAIADATGVTPEFLRPPVGLTNPRYRPVVRDLDVDLVGWDVRSFDRAPSASRSPDRVVARVMRRVRPGSVILLHDTGDAEQVVAIVAGLLDALDAADYPVVPLADLMAND